MADAREPRRGARASHVGRLTVALLAGCGAPVAAEPAPPVVVEVVDPLPQTGTFRREVAPGLVVAAYDPPEVADPGFSRVPPEQVANADRRLFVVTIDPARYRLDYLSELAIRGGALRGTEWAARDGLQVVFNPGMFEPDSRATGYTRAGELTSQPAVRRNALYRAWFVADPVRDGLPAVAVLDRAPPKGEGTYGAYDELPADFRVQLADYRIVVQSLAVVLHGEAVYPPRTKQWSELAFGVDREGRAVVVFSRFPYEMRELGARVAALGLGIDGLLHGEGGPEATLVVRAGGVELVQVGSYESGFADDSNRTEWVLPAVLGVRER